jgi:hypothetical protein
MSRLPEEDRKELDNLADMTDGTLDDGIALLKAYELGVERMYKFVKELEKMREEEGLEPLKSSDVVEIRPGVYTFRDKEE